MTQNFDLFLNSLKVDYPKFLSSVDLNRFKEVKQQLTEIKSFIEPAVNIALLNQIPTKLINELDRIVENYNEINQQLISYSWDNPSMNNYENYNLTFSQIKNYCDSFFESSSSNFKPIIINTVKGFGEHSIDQKTSLLTNSLREVDDLTKKTETLFKELEQKATKNVISDYAKVFLNQETDYRNNSKSWLTYAIILSISFVVLLVLSIIFKWFNSITTLTTIHGVETSSTQIFNYPLLISKILVVSFFIFIITFCFKQYSVYKNLEIVNQQRKNAINSYKLFDASLSDNDSASKNALMMQLAKSIYEMTHTGFLNNAKSENSNQILEFTKFISNPNNH